MDQPVLIAALWILVAGILATVVLLLRQRHVTQRLRHRAAEFAAEVRIRDEELRHFVTTRLPALSDALHHLPVTVPEPLHQELSTTDFGHNLESGLGQFTNIMDKAAGRAEQAAKATLKTMMRNVQSLASEQQWAISAMQDRHDNPDVLEDLLKVDHTNSQLGRRAQATAVLCGSWPGQQRSASSLTDVVRGATSRIRDYLRIQLNGESERAVVSRAVEPVVLAVAELLDNAARHSQPNASVEVNFQPAHNGMAIVIDDAGVGMNIDETERAARLLSGDDAVDINRLGDPPRIGFAVTGVLAARYGFTVSVDTRSPYGGVRAVVFIPNQLLTRAPRRAPVTSGDGTAEQPLHDAVQAPQEQQTTASGLPKRSRRHQVLPKNRATEPAASIGIPPQPEGRPGAAGLGAWQRGTRSGRASEGSSGT